MVFSIFILVGVAGLTSSDIGTKRDSGWIVAGYMPGLLIGVWGVLRTLRLGVVIDASGIRVRGFGLRDQVTPWNEVESIACEQVDNRAGLPLYAPVIRLAGTSGEEVPVRPLATYSLKDAQRKTELLRGLSGSPTVITNSAAGRREAAQ